MRKLFITALPLFVIMLMAGTSHAEFSKRVIKAAQKLQTAVTITKTKKMTGAEASIMWALMQGDVLTALNGGIPVVNQQNMNAFFKATIITVPSTKMTGATIKTGVLQAQFYPLKGQYENRPDWVVVLYQAIGNIPSSTFHIAQYEDGRYILGAAMERTNFLNKHPQLQWRGMQIQVSDNGWEFSSFFVPSNTVGNINRSQVLWKWRKGKLTPLMWFPEVDYYTNKKGEVVKGRGPGEVIKDS